MKLQIVIIGLTMTSSWGNGHATTYRALVKALATQGHHVTFLERDVPWYRAHRDLPLPAYCKVELYEDLRQLPRRFAHLIAAADLVILGSYVPGGAAIGDWITSSAGGVTAFYDIDTPVTLAGLDTGKLEYLSATTIPRFDLYLSFTGGPVLDLIENVYGSPRAAPLYCAVDPQLHAPIQTETRWHLGYLGTYSEDRQTALEQLLVEPARRTPRARFVVAGPQYPATIRWPANVERIEHVPPSSHSDFYCAQLYALNLTRNQMMEAGFSPSVRLFEAAACGVPIISDRWPGLDFFFAPGKEILIADIPENVVAILRDLPDERRRAIAAAARERVLRSHTGEHRAKTLEDYYVSVLDRKRSRRKIEAVA